MSLLALRAAIVAGISAKVPELRTCKAHPGRFEPGELKRYAIASPAVLVACLGVASAENQADGSVQPKPRWGAFVLTTDRAGASRDDASLALVNAMLSLLAAGNGNDWGGAADGAPEEVKAENLYSGPLDRLGVALWVVTWRQAVTVDERAAADAGVFRHLHVEYDLAPVDGAREAVDDVELGQP